MQVNAAFHGRRYPLRRGGTEKSGGARLEGEWHMEQGAEMRHVGCSRRALLRSVAVAAAGAAAVGAGISKPAEAQAKAPQNLVGYQDSPHGTQECDNCAQFAPPSSCKVVDGTISPKGWCKIYAAKAGQ
jgi:hypothetical protein